jgi:hypothetical protein
MSGAKSSLQTLTRVLNTSGRVFERTGIPLVKLDADALIDEARRTTRLENFGEEGFREPLRRLLYSFEHEAKLSLLGRIAARQDIGRLLQNKLKMERDRQRQPEIAAQPVRRPLFVTGLPRTGTTLLHGLLAQDPANRAPLHWEMAYPSPPPERSRHQSDRRIAMAERNLQWFHRLAPELRHIHQVGARLPEECLIITSHSFLSFQYQTSHHVPSYQTWLESHDLTPSYAQHRQFLQHLQWHCGGERWVLKAPAHVFGMRPLFAAYPDAGVIFTHRDPLEVAASMASLHVVLRSTFSDDVDPIQVGEELNARFADGIMRAMAARDAGCAPSEQFLDIQYRDLVRDPLGTVRRIYAHYDLPFTGVAEDRMQRFLGQNPKDKHGAHRYTLDMFGLTVEGERERYRAYRSRFGF